MLRLTLPRRTVRLRFTALYVALFLLSGFVLLVITNVLFRGSTVTRPARNVMPAVGQDDAYVRIAQLQAQLSQQGTAETHRLLTGSAIALAVMLLLSVVLGRVVAGRVLRPLRAMTAATRRISADNLHERLAVPGPVDEVKDLSDTIDGLLERLEGAFAAQRRFVANASHELRTPLATMRAALDVAVSKPEPAPPQTLALADRLRTELDQVDRLLEGFLTLARAQHGALPGRDLVSLGTLASEALAARAAEITAKGLTVQRNGDASVHGSETLLRRMVDNVVDNAVRHNHEGGWILVTAEEDTLVVESGGEVLDQRQVAQLAQPFRRLVADRTGSDGGTGLGLAIVAAIASAHGGTLDLQARAGGGLRVVIALPRTAEVPA